MSVDSPASDNLTHDRIERETVGIVDILIACQPPIDRLPKQPLKPMERVLARTGVAQCCCRKIGQPERVIKLAHHQQAAVRTDLRTPELHPHTAVEIHPICPLRARTLWVIHETSPS